MNKTSSVEKLVGQPLKRVEDAKFLRGDGLFTDDERVHGLLYGAVVRSPHPHAEVVSIDVSEALELAGVATVLTAESIANDITGAIPSFTSTAPWDIRNLDGNTLPDGSQTVLATDRVRYVGDPVAFVVADTAATANAAAELVAVDYRPLDVAMTFDEATAEGAPQLWDDAPGNRTLNIERGNAAETDAMFAAADHVVQCSVDVNRIVPVFMEPRSATGRFDNGRFHLQTGTQSAHSLKGALAHVLGVDADTVRVTVPDMGGGFGARNSLYPEFLMVLVAARQLGKPVRWTASRSESFLTDAQSRDQKIHGELAIMADGTFKALRSHMQWRHGGYLWARNAAVLSGFFPPTSGGVYQIKAIHVRMDGAFTNTTPQAAYRGIGRVESNYLIERLIDRAAQTLNRDPAELRRQNLIQPEQMPWVTPTGSTYTSGEFEKNLDRALLLADRDGFEKRRATSERDGLRRGFGLGLYIENDGASPSEYSNATIDASEEMVRLGVGTQDFGMGHKTMFAQIAADTLELPYEHIDIFFGDTDRIAKGFGSAGSRSARLGGSAIVNSARALLEVAKIEAAEKLEAAEADIDYGKGVFTVRGTDKRLTLFDLARDLSEADKTLEAEAEFVSQDSVHQNGCQICEVTVDPQTGVVTIERHLIVADVGRAVNPLIVEGQLHGGIGQGLSQAGYENVVYDAESGQTLSASLMDFTIPKADDLPMFDSELNEIIEADNPVGAKGAGEGPTSGAPGAYVNAVLDALAPLGVESIDMPLTPQRVWQAIRTQGR